MAERTGIRASAFYATGQQSSSMSVDTVENVLRRVRVKFSVFAGVVLGLIPLASFAGMGGLSTHDPDWRVLYGAFGVGLPGMLFSAFVRMVLNREGTILGQTLIIVLFNVAFYSAVAYAVLSLGIKLIHLVAFATGAHHS